MQKESLTRNRGGAVLHPYKRYSIREISDRLGGNRVENEERKSQGELFESEKRDRKRVTLFSFQDSVGRDTSSGKAKSSGKGNASPIFMETYKSSWMIHDSLSISAFLVSALFFEWSRDCQYRKDFRRIYDIFSVYFVFSM